MSVMTVLGMIDADCLGITLAHEHIFINLINQFSEFTDPVKKKLSEEKLSLSNHGAVLRNPYAVKDNLLINDVTIAVKELSYFKNKGGSTVVDCTSIGIGRNPKFLKTVAQKTGLNIIAGCGYYTYDTHPSEMNNLSAEQIAEQMIADLTVGVDGTDIRAGIIGEIGTSNPIRPNEIKNLIAAAKAYKRTGAAIQVHTYPWGQTGHQVIELLVSNGTDPSKIVICHTDVEIHTDYIKSLLDKGVFVQFDNFGKEFYIDKGDRRGFTGGVFARDLERVITIKHLIECGYDKQLLITNDLCLKAMLKEYGGWGYAHILEHIMPMMNENEINNQTINNILCNNPKRLLNN